MKILKLFKNSKFSLFSFQNTKKFASQFSRLRIKEREVRKQQEIIDKEIEKNTPKVQIELSEAQKQKMTLYTNPDEIFDDMKANKDKSDKDPTVDIVVALNVDPKKGDQVVRGIYKMPGGAHKVLKLCVFTSPEFQEGALKAGADYIGTEETIKDIQNGIINFEKLVCSMEMLPVLKGVGKILGPMGLMPNTKVGTAAKPENLEQIIRDIKLGSKEFKVDPSGQVHGPLGKLSYSNERLKMNLDSFMRTLLSRKPESIKTRYFMFAYLTTTRGRSYQLNLKYFDPNSTTYFYNK